MQVPKTAALRQLLAQKLQVELLEGKLHYFWPESLNSFECAGQQIHRGQLIRFHAYLYLLCHLQDYYSYYLESKTEPGELSIQKLPQQLS